MRCMLPEGIYVVSAAFREQEGTVSFDFRGKTYEAEMGVTAFGRLDEMAKAADKVPAEPFCGRTFDTPVAVLPAGVYPFKMTRADLVVYLARAITIVGEQMGVSPNAADDVSKLYTDRGLAYASEFDGKQPQSLAIPVKDRKYYRVEVTNESDGSIVSLSNPIWLD